MEKVVNSRKQKLPGPNIIAMSIEELVKDVPKDKALAAIAKETTMPNTDVVQFGNTVFITHVNEEKSKSWGRAFNVDTAKNFVANGFRFFTHLQEMGIKRYISNYEGTIYDPAVEVWKRRAEMQEVEDEEDRTVIQKAYSEKHGQTVVAIKLGTEPLA